VGPNGAGKVISDLYEGFQSSVRINVGPNEGFHAVATREIVFQSSVRINVGPNGGVLAAYSCFLRVSILRED